MFCHGSASGADLRGAYRWEEFGARVKRSCCETDREEMRGIVYRRETPGGASEGCVLTHDNYLEKGRSLRCGISSARSPLSEYPAGRIHAVDFMIGSSAVVCGRFAWCI